MSTLQVGTISEKVTDAGVAVDGVTLKDGDVTIADKIIHDGDTNTAIRFPSADTVTIETGGSERARVDGSGVFHVNCTAQQIDTNEQLRCSGKATITASGGVALNLNRDTDDGQTLRFHRGGTSEGAISVASDQLKIFATKSSGNCGIGFFSNNTIRPLGNDGALTDNEVDMGHSANRFANIRATNGSIVTSDRNEKQDIEELNDAEARVAVACKGLLRKFRWRDAVALKGDDARTHFGIIAQDLKDAFTAEDLDASKYGMFCSDTWWELDGETYDTEEEAPSDATKKTRLGVRYSELLAFIISAI